MRFEIAEKIFMEEGNEEVKMKGQKLRENL